MTIDNKPETLITQDESLRGVLPKDFWYAAATASYQIEGAWNEDGKGVGIWDELMNKPEWDATGNGKIACDSYHLWKEDIALIKSYGMNSYRFSIAWSRVKPKGGWTLVQPGADDRRCRRRGQREGYRVLQQPDQRFARRGHHAVDHHLSLGHPGRARPQVRGLCGHGADRA